MSDSMDIPGAVGQATPHPDNFHPHGEEEPFLGDGEQDESDTRYQPCGCCDPRLRALLSIENKTTAESYPVYSFSFIMVVAVLQSIAQSGQTAILALYAQDFLGLSETTSVVIVSVNVALQNFIAPLGGVISDRVLGNYRSQFWSGLIWTVAALLMQLTVIQPIVGPPDGWFSITCAMTGLLLTAIGYGIINPIQSIFVGDQYGKGLDTEKVRSFGWYYFFCNVGNMIGEAGCPILRQYVGFETTLTFITVSIVPAFFVFWAGSRYYVKVPPSWSSNSLECLKADWKALLHVMKIFALFPVFWALYYQQSSVWVFQGTSMNLELWGDIEIPPDLMPSLNDFLVLVMIPLFDIFYTVCRYVKFEWTPLRKMTLGMISTILAYICAAGLEIWMNRFGSTTILWQIPQYVFISAAEVLIAVPGLEFCYSQSPASLKSTVTALWYIAQAVGNLIVAGVAEIDISNIANEFLLYAVLMTVVTLSFVIVASFYEYRDYGSQDLALEVEESSADTNDSLCVDEDGVSQQETVESEDHEGTDSILFERTSNPL